MTKTITEEQDTDSLGSQLVRIQEHSVDGSRVEGKILGFSDNGETIDIEIERLTTGKRFTEELDKPEPWSDSFKFVRLMKYCGYDTGGTQQLEGHRVPLIHQDDEWEMDVDRFPGEAAFDRPQYFSGLARGTIVGLLSLGIQPLATEIAPYIVIFAEPYDYQAALIILGIIWLVALLYQVGFGIRPEEDDDRVAYI